MNPIGIVVCNYNKSEFVINCIKSILESKIINFDIYVVDNASQDDSVKRIKELYSDKVTLIENKDNLGGSGGFNTGLRILLKKDYKYLVCLDNDILIDENAINSLYKYMEENPDVGMAGSRVYHMQMPDYIQQAGIILDFNNTRPITQCADQLEDGSFDRIINCDTVATCAVMIRSSIIKNSNIGIMPQDNFIYWDDMEWGYRIKKAGYKVITLADSKVLHNMSANIRQKNTFTKYYIFRNKGFFFLKYCPENLLDKTILSLLDEFFDEIYINMFNDAVNVAKSVNYAFFDLIKNIRGKAKDYKILENDSNHNKLINYLNNHNSFAIIENEYHEDAKYLREFIKQNAINIRESSVDKAEIVFDICSYIFNVKDFSLNKIYIDTEKNCIISKEDTLMVQNYNYSKFMFEYIHQDALMELAKEIRECN